MFFSVEKNILEIFLSVTQTMENKCGECDCKRRIIFLKFPWLLDTYFWNSWHVSALYKYSVIQILICSSRTFCHFLHLTLNTAIFTPWLPTNTVFSIILNFLLSSLTGLYGIFIQYHYYSIYQTLMANFLVRFLYT